MNARKKISVNRILRKRTRSSSPSASESLGGAFIVGSAAQRLRDRARARARRCARARTRTRAMSAHQTIKRVLLTPLAQALGEPNDGTPLAEHAPLVAALSAQEFERVFCRQTGARTRTIVNAFFDALQHTPDVSGAAPAASAAVPQSSARTRARGDVTNQAFWREMTDKLLLSDDERRSALQEALDDDERASFGPGDACQSNESDADADMQYSQPPDAAESDDDDNDDDEDEAEVDEKSADEADRGGDGARSSAHAIDAARRKNTKKRKAASENKKMRDDGGGGASSGDERKKAKVAASARSGERDRKMSDAARKVKAAQAERKRKRKDDYADKAYEEEWQKTLGDVIQVAAVTLLQRQAAAKIGQRVEQPFWRLVLADESGDEEICAMARALSAVDVKLDLALEDAERANANEVRVMRDFVANSESVRRVDDAKVGDASTCTVLRRRVERSTLAAYEALRVREDGSVKPVTLIALAALEPLIDALWFCDNFMTATQEHVRRRLLKIRGYNNGKSTVATALSKLRNDTAKNSATVWLYKALRKALDRVDMSVSMLHIDPPAPVDED